MYRAVFDTRFSPREHALGDYLAALLWVLSAGVLLALAAWSAEPCTLV